MRLRARTSAKRFSEGEFAKGWNKATDEILQLQVSPRSVSLMGAESQMISASYVFVLVYDLYQLIW